MLQLSDNDPRKQGLVLSVASNLMKHYDPDKVAIEVVAFGPGIELLRPENPNRKMVESLVAQGARFDICLNTVDTLERESGKRPEFISAATPVQVGVAQILFLTENGYTLVQAVTAADVIAQLLTVIASAAKQSISPFAAAWIASLRSQ